MIVAAAGGFERLHGSLDGADADAVARACAASGPRPSSCSPRPASAGARRWLDDIRHRRLAITGDDLVAAGPHRRRRSAEGLARAMVAMLDGRAPDREASCARQYPLEP